MKIPHAPLCIALLVLPVAAIAGGIASLERSAAITSATAAGLTKPYTLQRVPARRLLAHFDLTALTATERAELDALDAHDHPLCGKGDGSPMILCPVRKGTEFGKLTAKEGGCMWSPRLGIPPSVGSKAPVIGVNAIRCSADKAEWERIQRTALPR